ncbi:DoxX-like protein [Luteibacter rhizovicinus]|uniref:DoxX-like protein n=1 Tax=Luteibacter rhizovicinus TaxID=242606 RepID=A0A4R3YPV1_9GAMM|nr:DoxX family protein [Luteibacter rhizovicinus]TCV93204.1 DoxX-like protein [Luteibacter rhizovicinus]
MSGTVVIRRYVPMRVRALKALRWAAMFFLCAAYLHDAVAMLTDFDAAVAQMRHLGLTPPNLFAALVVAIELGASAMILAGRGRWAGALMLAAFTVATSLLTHEGWAHAMPGTTANALYESLAMTGGFLLICWMDITDSMRAPVPAPGTTP